MSRLSFATRYAQAAAQHGRPADVAALRYATRLTPRPLGGVIATVQNARDRIITWSRKMATKIQQTQADLVKAITDIAEAIPLARAVQLYQFALFLKTHPLPSEETFDEIAVDEALWEAQFAATDNDKLAALVAAVEAEINEGKTLPMFDEHGEFIEHK